MGEGEPKKLVVLEGFLVVIILTIKLKFEIRMHCDMLLFESL